MQDFSFELSGAKGRSPLCLLLRKTGKGWLAGVGEPSVTCRPDGGPFIEHYLEEQGIALPKGFSQSMHWLWRMLDTRAFHPWETQIRLQELADWISLFDSAQDVWGGCPESMPVTLRQRRYEALSL